MLYLPVYFFKLSRSSQMKSKCIGSYVFQFLFGHIGRLGSLTPLCFSAPLPEVLLLASNMSTIEAYSAVCMGVKISPWRWPAIGVCMLLPLSSGVSRPFEPCSVP